MRKRFNEEDLDYFDDDSCDENEDAADSPSGNSGGVHAHSNDSPNSVNEDWDDSQGSNGPELPEEDFAGRPQEQNNSMPLSDKCGMLIY